MNKELIKKYKAEFDNWLSGGVLLFKWSHEEPSCWLREDDVISNNLWCHKESDIKYIIIKDEYVEFRKALAEGKTVEVLHYTGYKEFDQNPWKLFAIGVSTFDKPVENYRIKPEEPQFKVGDWVRNSISRGDIGKIVEFTNEGYSKTVCLTHNNHCFLQWELWRPQPGEWVIPDSGINKDTFVVIKYNGVSLIPERCQPFIGELPTILQQPE